MKKLISLIHKVIQSKGIKGVSIAGFKGELFIDENGDWIWQKIK